LVFSISAEDEFRRRAYMIKNELGSNVPRSIITKIINDPIQAFTLMLTIVCPRNLPCLRKNLTQTMRIAKALFFIKTRFFIHKPTYSRFHLRKSLAMAFPSISIHLDYTTVYVPYYSTRVTTIYGHLRYYPYVVYGRI
jgi:hypothetical protein